MFKSYGDLKSGLDLSRERKIPCRTSMREAQILRELESRNGKFTENIELIDMVQREKARKLRQAQSLDKSRTRLLINKIQRSSLQKARLESPERLRLLEKKLTPTKPPSEVTAKLREIELTY